MGRKLLMVLLISLLFLISIKDFATSDSNNLHLSSEGIWLKGDMHMHTIFSDGAPNTVEDRVQQARKNGLDFIIITDHVTAETDRKTLIAYYNAVLKVDESNPDITVLWGFEWTYRWHILGYGLTPDDVELLSENIQEAITAINNAGGIAFFAHPDWSGASYNDLYVLKGLRGFEGFNYGHMESFIRPGGEWDALLMSGKNYIIIGGSDAHGSEEAGQWGTTFVYCPNATKKGIIEGLKRGCVYFSESIPINGSWRPVFRLGFTVNGTLMGQTIMLSSEEDEVTVNLQINLSIVEGKSFIHTISIISNGKIVKSIFGGTSSRFSSDILIPHVKVPSYFRVIANDTNGKYVVSNPIFIGKFAAKMENPANNILRGIYLFSFLLIAIASIAVIVKHLRNKSKFQPPST
ncbi:MAG: CehA/McbA family metallohydrolase [Candidatus Korarchaeota archaeon]|nr:CehA/McbA family metallohydrolase [Candidatus Korarchaeota archaeon]